MKQARNPIESDMRKKILAMDTKTLRNEIRKAAGRLTTKMRRLESSGYDRYSTNYGKLRDYNEEKTGTHYFSYEASRTMSLDEKRNYLFQMLKFEKYKNMTKTEIVAYYKKQAKKLSTDKLKLSSSDIMKIDDYMKEWREFIQHSNIIELFTSDEAREIFSQQSKQNMTRSQFDMFMRELEKFNTGTYDKEDFALFIKTYDFKSGKPVVSLSDGVRINPLNGRFLSSDMKYYHTSLRVDRSGEKLIRWDSKSKKSEDLGLKLSDFSKESLYDYIRNDQKNKRR